MSLPKLLAIETASLACSAALLVNGEVEERYALAPRQHADLILPMIESLLAEAEMDVTQLDAITFGQGPGSFTGVRIAASVVQGIAFGADLPVVPVSSLAAVALAAIKESGLKKVMCAFDARMSEVYWGVYTASADGGVTLTGEEVVCKPADAPLPEGTGSVSSGWVGAGAGWDSYGKILIERAGEQVVRLLPDFEPRAKDVAVLGAEKYMAGVRLPAEQALPVYLRDKVTG